MNIPSAKCMAPSLVVLPDDLIEELLSFLPVKYLLRFRCVSKSWKTLISDSAFVKLHHKRSATENPQFTLIMSHTKHLLKEGIEEVDYSVVPYPMSRLIESPMELFPLSLDPYYFMKDKECNFIVGTCNGLICLSGSNYNSIKNYAEYWLRLWNPATRTTSPKFGQFGEIGKIRRPDGNFKFGCDNSTGTYKVVAFHYNHIQRRSVVKILSFGDNVWRDIESFPVDPLEVDCINDMDYCPEKGVYLSGTINWFAIHNNLRYNFENIIVGQFVIISLDLGTETYNQYMLPRELDEVPSTEPAVSVLGGCLCFSYSHMKTDFEFVVWQMKEFGVEESWTQLFTLVDQIPIEKRYTAENARKYCQIIPLLLSEDGRVFFMLNIFKRTAYLFNWIDDIEEKIKINASRPITNNNITREDLYFEWAMDYVESLVSAF